MQRYKKSLYKKLTFEIVYNELNKINLKKHYHSAVRFFRKHYY